MRIQILAAGKVKPPFVDACNEYLRRISARLRVEVLEIELRGHKDEARLNREENLEFRKWIQKNPAYHRVALDRRGRMRDSGEFSSWLTQIRDSGKDILFLVGGAMGLDDETLSLCQEKISFSPLTFPHQLFRVMLLEQVYRAMTISAGEPYHK